MLLTVLRFCGAKKLTSNATFLLIQQHLVDGKLVERDVARLNASKARHLYVTPAIANLIDGADPMLGFPSAEATVITDRYLAGWLMVTSLTARTDPPRARPDLERLENVDEAWVMCFRKPRPGWRLFGRFAEPSKFVALHAHDRDALAGGAYEAKAEEMISTWKAMFEEEEPHRGASVEDYVGGVWRDVSE